MNSLRPILLSLSSALLATILFCQAAHADTLGTRKNQRGAITQIDKGVWQMAIDSTMQLNYLSEGEQSESRSSLAANIILRYFIKPKVGVSGRLGAFLRKNGEIGDQSFTATGWANYYMRLGEGMFFAPGLGGGLVVGQRDLPGAAEGMVVRNNLVGVVLSTELLAAMYLSPRFSLTAGPDFSLLMANADGATTEFSGAFKIGAAYSY